MRSRYSHKAFNVECIYMENRELLMNPLYAPFIALNWFSLQIIVILAHHCKLEKNNQQDRWESNPVKRRDVPSSCAELSTPQQTENWTESANIRWHWQYFLAYQTLS